jgi:hypothetical protein
MANDIAIAILAFTLGAALGIWVLFVSMKAFLRHVYHCGECKRQWIRKFDQHEDREGKCWWKMLENETKGETK